MSTREGNVVYVSELINEAIDKSKNIINEKNANLDDIDEVSKKVGVGALIFNYLKSNKNKDIIFDLDDTLRFDGETGPYIQYTYVRTKSILEKLKFDISNVDVLNIKFDELKKEEEKRKKKTIQKERKVLQKVYNESGKETPDNELVMKIETAISKTPHLSKEEIEQMKAKILAKQIAYNYKMFGSVKLKLLSEIMSAKEMKQTGIIDLVEEESIKLSNDKEKEFKEKSDLERRLNKEIQEEYAKYNEKDEMEKVINMLKGFPKEERIKIIEEIKDFVSNKAKQINAKEVEEEER